MKHWLVAMALICLGSTANALTEVRQELLGNCTTYSVAIPGVVTTPVPLLAASLNGATTSFLKLQEGRTWMSVQNSSGAAGSDIYMMFGTSNASPNNDLSLTAPTGLTSSAGILIPARGTWSAPIPARNLSGLVVIPYVLTGQVDTGKVQFTQCKP